MPSTAQPFQAASARAARHHPPVRRRCCKSADLRYIVHALLERLVGFLRGLKHYMVRVALHVVLPVCSPASDGPTSGVFRKADLTQIAKKRQMWDSYDRT